MLMMGQLHTAIDSDGRLLTEEEPVRMTLLRFNTLGEFQFAHIVDDYTFLEGRRNGALFRHEFIKHQQLVLATHPEAMALFKRTVLDAPDARVYDAAVTTNRRVAEKLTIPSCKRCNKAMDREAAHVGATYRCFVVTRHSNVPKLESTSKEAIAAKKVIQQIAFYFQPVIPVSHRTTAPSSPSSFTTTGTTGGADPVQVQGWLPKSEDHLLRDATLWRCVAHLWNWGRSPLGGGVRFRMIAVFHASHFIYLSGGMRDTLPFETWHVHVWRPFCMQHYASQTFLGMRQAEAGVFFDLSRQDGARWEAALRARMLIAADALETFTQRSPGMEEQVVRFEEAMVHAGVNSEASLLRFLASQEQPQQQQADPEGERWRRRPSAGVLKKEAVRAALGKLMAYFRYNLSGGSGSGFMLRQCNVLQAELLKALPLTAI